MYCIDFINPVEVMVYGVVKCQAVFAVRDKKGFAFLAEIISNFAGGENEAEKHNGAFQAPEEAGFTAIRL